MLVVKEGAPVRLRALVICLARTQICSSIVPQYQKCMYGNSLGICRLLPFVQPLLTPNPCEFSFLASSSRAYKPALDKYNRQPSRKKLDTKTSLTGQRIACHAIA